MRSMLRPRLQPGLLRRGLCAASRPTTHFGYRTVDEADKERLRLEVARLENRRAQAQVRKKHEAAASASVLATSAAAQRS